jgi:hypothetical protein
MAMTQNSHFFEGSILLFCTRENSGCLFAHKVNATFLGRIYGSDLI